jgi:O-antigen/teichoic acid export membrane protein
MSIEESARSVVLVSRRKSFLTMLAGSAINSALASIIALAITPIAVADIGTHVYGAWLASGDLFVWLQSSDFGVSNLMVQRVGAAHGKGDSSSVASNFGTGMVLILIISLLIGCVGFGISLALPTILNIQGDAAIIVSRCFRIGSISCVFTLLHFGFLGYFRAVQRTIAVNVFSLIGLVINLVVVLAFLAHGLALYSLAFGMLLRSLWLLASSVIYFVVTEWRQVSQYALYDATIRRELVRATPATTLGVLAFVVMNSSDALVISILIGNASVPAYSFTKKAADVIRSLLDMVAYAAYPSFAHLVGSNQERKASAVYSNILTLFLLVAISAVVGYITINHIFVDSWVGKTFYLGPLFTTMFGLQMICSSGSILANYLYRSTDHVVAGSLLFSLEAVIKIFGVCMACYMFGAIGIPVVSVIVSSSFIALNCRQTLKKIGLGSRGFPRPFQPLLVIPACCVMVSVIYQYGAVSLSPPYQVAGGVLITLLSACSMLLLIPCARELIPLGLAGIRNRPKRI